ncbi:MAG: bifunctional diaminohydroxyphosphoribosylaminopyrimidine deaminase/5-amino-6-(5-phosphoribosylamino)uracil reductase RibD [Chitinophagales bacterium]|nr:bifunctional diaminohydroxyphosphoribosylaminopyrimidine deaminase/5-amino-6-(5-phosphoribosylamino)uracil reductase RibD [Chitinophagales bacterium]
MNHEQYIRRCLELAERGKGYVSPNPMVGAVLVHNDVVIGEGWHKEYGGPHAEVNCLKSVSPEHKHLITDSTMYVSLEPCAHHGKTPPCATRVVNEQVKRVVICNVDPFEQVAGKGIEILNNANIETTTGVLDDAGKWVNRRFFCYNEYKRPYIILKWAQTQDGFIAPLNRERFQITNKQSTQLIHKWRTEEDAIMVGYNTAIHDNPELTAREWLGNNPLRIVLDKELKLSNDMKLFNNAAETWVLNKQQNDTVNNVSFVQMDFDKGVVHEVLAELYNARKQSLIVEGGAVLLQSFIDAGLWDEARVFTGDVILKEGIDAPVLANHTHAFDKAIAGDKLDVYINKESKYPYVDGWGL